MQERDRGGFNGWFDVNELMQICWLRFMEKILSNRYNVVLYALLDLEPMKRVECRSVM